MELPTDLNGLELAICIDARLQQRDQRSRYKLVSEVPEFSTANSCNAVSHPSDCEPMQVGRARLSQEKRETVGEQGDFACIAELRVSSWLTVQ